MDKNNEQNLSPEALRRMAGSPEGQQLLSLLQKTQGQRLAAASRQAAAGDLDGLKQTLAPLLDSPEVRDLLRQMGG